MRTMVGSMPDLHYAREEACAGSGNLSARVLLSPECLAKGQRKRCIVLARRMSPRMTHYDYHNYCADRPEHREVQE